MNISFKWLAILSVIIMMPLVTACSDDDPDNPENPENSGAGNGADGDFLSNTLWTCTDVTGWGAGEAKYYYGATLEFGRKGQVTYTEDGERSTGTYTVNEKKKTLTLKGIFLSDDWGEEYTYTLSGKSMKLSIMAGTTFETSFYFKTDSTVNPGTGNDGNGGDGDGNGNGSGNGDGNQGDTPGVTVATKYAGGTGTEADPYRISNIEELRFFAQETNRGVSYKGKYLVLTKDIVDNPRVLDANGDLAVSPSSLREWTPASSYIENPFQGTFDGQGHTISGIYGNMAKETCLINYLSEAVVKNLVVKDSYLYAITGLCGLNKYGSYGDLLLHKVNFHSIINHGTTYFGITLGAYKYSVYLYDCGNYGKSFRTGIGRDADAIINCYNYGEVETDDFRDSSGLIANCLNVYNCFNYGSVTGKNGTERIGGIFRGSDDSHCVVNNCVNYGQVNPFNGSESAAVVNYVGDFVTIKNIYWLETSCIRGYKIQGTGTKITNANKMSEEEMKSQAFLDELNNNAKSISGACGWKRGKSGFPILEIVNE